MPSYRDETTNTWFCKFYYTDYQGNRRQKLKRGFALKREADAWEREFIAGAAFQPDMPFKAFYALFSRDTSPRLKKSTLVTREYIYNNHLAPFFDDMPLDTIDGVTVQRWQNELIEQGFQPTHLNNIERALSTVFNHAVRFYDLRRNPCRIAGNVGSKQPAQAMEFWTLDEYREAIEYVSNIKARTAITLLFWTGLRKGELLALTWKDINLEAKTLRVNKSLTRLQGESLITSPKTKHSIRTIGLPDQAIQALTEYRAVCFDTRAKIPVFPWEKRFIENGMQECFDSGAKRIRVHDLRHSHASLLIELGYSALLIAKRLGHGKIETTLNTYSHLWPNKEGEMLEHISSL